MHPPYLTHFHDDVTGAQRTGKIRPVQRHRKADAEGVPAARNPGTQQAQRRGDRPSLDVRLQEKRLIPVDMPARLPVDYKKL